MTTSSLLDRINQIMDESGAREEVVSRVAAAMSVSNRESLAELREELIGIQHLIKANAEQIKSLAVSVESLNKHNSRHPSLIWLLRFRTRKTIIWIIIAFLLLSFLYVPEIRTAVVEFLF